MQFLDFFDSGHFYGETAVGAKDLTRSVAWYCAMFDLVERTSSRLELTVGHRGGKSRSLIPLVTLVQIPVGRTEAAVEHHPKTRQELISKGITAGPIQKDSG